jgi:hypothetical protein
MGTPVCFVIIKKDHRHVPFLCTHLAYFLLCRLLYPHKKFRLYKTNQGWNKKQGAQHIQKEQDRKQHAHFSLKLQG